MTEDEARCWLSGRLERRHHNCEVTGCQQLDQQIALLHNTIDAVRAQNAQLKAELVRITTRDE